MKECSKHFVVIASKNMFPIKSKQKMKLKTYFVFFFFTSTFILFRFLLIEKFDFGKKNFKFVFDYDWKMLLNIILIQNVLDTPSCLNQTFVIYFQFSKDLLYN